MEFLRIFTVKHVKVVHLIVSFIKLGFLNACVPNEEVCENIPIFLGRGDGSNKCLVLLRESHVDEVKGGGIELLVNELIWLQVVQVLGRWMKSLLNDSPKLNGNKVDVRAHVILPIGKARSIKWWWRTT
jgi:hypothetical protein